jgi:tellurite resistance protein
MYLRQSTELMRIEGMRKEEHDREARGIDHHAALIYTMVLVAAAEGHMTDSELEVMSRLVRTLPVFATFERDRVDEIGQECAELLRQEDGLDTALDMIAKALPAPLRETAYTLACDVAAADGKAVQDELRLLEMIRHRLHIERLVAAAIERGAQARYRVA